MTLEEAKYVLEAFDSTPLVTQFPKLQTHIVLRGVIADALMVLVLEEEAAA